MTKREVRRQIDGKKEQQAKHRRWNLEHPAAAAGKKAMHKAQWFERIAKKHGIAAARAERKKLRNLKYKERRQARKPIFKTIAGWLKPPKSKEEKASENIKTNIEFVEKAPAKTEVAK